MESQRALLRTRAGRAVAGGLAVLALLTVTGLIVLWPGGGVPTLSNNLVISQGIVPAQVILMPAGELPRQRSKSHEARRDPPLRSRQQP